MILTAGPVPMAAPSQQQQQQQQQQSLLIEPRPSDILVRVLYPVFSL